MVLHGNNPLAAQATPCTCAKALATPHQVELAHPWGASHEPAQGLVAISAP